MTDNMGTKNVRGKTATFSTRAPMSSRPVPQMAALTPASKAGSVVALNHNINGNITPDDSIIETEVKPVALLFRSYQTGTLYTSNFEPSGTASQKCPTANAKKRLSATSPVFVPANLAGGTSSAQTPTLEKLKELLASIPKDVTRAHQVQQGAMSLITPTKSRDTAFTTPSGQSANTGITSPTYSGSIDYRSKNEFIRSFTGRADKTKKDVIIAHYYVYRNAIRINEFCCDGMPNFQANDEFNPTNYHFETALSEMSPEERIAFWAENCVEIIMDIDGLSVCRDGFGDSAKEINDKLMEKQKGAVEIMKRLGDDFTAYTRTVTVTIKFPEAALPAKPNTKAQMETTAFKAVQRVANKLKELTSLTRLEIILRTPAHTHPPISLEQLNYALPFYELPFIDWELMWQNTYMSRPEVVRGWPISYLDIERFKIDRETAKALREKERALQEQVFIRKSISPTVHELPFVPRVEKPNPL
jgi:hypothetical protein